MKSSSLNGINESTNQLSQLHYLFLAGYIHAPEVRGIYALAAGELAERRKNHSMDANAEAGD